MPKPTAGGLSLPSAASAPPRLVGAGFSFGKLPAAAATATDPSTNAAGFSVPAPAAPVAPNLADE